MLSYLMSGGGGGRCMCGDMHAYTACVVRLVE